MIMGESIVGDKLYVSANTLRTKSWELVEQVVMDDFIPDYLQEFFFN